MAVVCCASCGYRRRQRGPRSKYGRPAGTCPNCNLGMLYWTDWLDPRRLMGPNARLEDTRLNETT